MSLQRTEVWQVFLHARGATAVRVDAEASTHQVNADSALAAWQAMEPLLPASSRLHVCLGSDVAVPALIQGGDDLSEADWQALAEAHFSARGLGRDDYLAVIDGRWHSGKRAAVAVDMQLLQQLRESGVAFVVSTAALLLAVARSRASDIPTILCVRDDGGWTVVAFDAQSCLAMACYPAAASVEQIELEAGRMTTASGLAPDVKRIVMPAIPRNLSQNVRPVFAFDLLLRTRRLKAFAALSLVFFLAVVVALTQAWHEVDAQTKAVTYKQKQLDESLQAVRQQAAPKLSASLVNRPAELGYDWQQTFGDLEDFIAHSKGVQLGSVSLQASGDVGQMTLDVPPQAMEEFTKALKTDSDNPWRMASINRGRGEGAQGYQVLLLRGKAQEE